LAWYDFHDEWVEESPCFRDFVEKAAMVQAEKDFGKMIKGC
jgi:hypothetical protein